MCGSDRGRERGEEGGEEEQRHQRAWSFSPQCHPPAPLWSALQTHIKRTRVQPYVHTCSALSAPIWCSLEVKKLHPLGCSRLEKDSLKGRQAPGNPPRQQHFMKARVHVSVLCTAQVSSATCCLSIASYPFTHIRYHPCDFKNFFVTIFTSLFIKSNTRKTVWGE